MGRKKGDNETVHLRENSLLRTVIQSIANEADKSESEINNLLLGAGLTDVVKVAASIPFSADVERSVAGVGSAGLEAAKKTQQISQTYLKVPKNVEDMNYGDGVKRGIIGQRDEPENTEHVEIDSAYPAYTLYKKSARALIRGIQRGDLSIDDVKSVLGENVADPMIVEFCKALSPGLSEVEKSLDNVETVERQATVLEATKRMLRKRGLLDR